MLRAGVRVERPAHYDSFAEFHYSYHYGDSYIPRLEQTEPLKAMCSHFLDCTRTGEPPLTSGQQGLQLVRILEASSRSLQAAGAPVRLDSTPPPTGARHLQSDLKSKTAMVKLMGA